MAFADPGVVTWGGWTGALAVVLVGCTPQTVTYGYTAHERSSPLPSEGPDAPSPEAEQMLANARTVAFSVPESCNATCMAALPTLERAAEQSGFQVVSWQNLRGPRRPIDFAREANVDVLFQIDRIDSTTRDAPAPQRSLSFFERGPAGDTPLEVSPTLLRICDQYEAQRHPTLAVPAVTVDIQVLSVGDGVTRWRYHRGVAQAPDSSAVPASVAFSGHSTPSKGGGVLARLGAMMILVGTGFIVVEQLSHPDPLNPSQGDFSTHGVSWGMAVGGVAALGGGTHLLVKSSGNPPPEDILCDGLHLVPDQSSSAGPPEDRSPALASSALAPLVDELQHVKGSH